MKWTVQYSDLNLKSFSDPSPGSGLVDFKAVYEGSQFQITVMYLHIVCIYVDVLPNLLT